MCVLSRGHLDVFQIKEFGIECQQLSGAGFFLRESSFGTRVKTGEESKNR
jgi:hypothetical protein